VTRVVIIGGGFGGLSAAKALAGADVEIVLIDRTNHHVFQPLLYQVATTALAPSDITAPIRWVLRRKKNITTLLGSVESIDRSARTVRVAGEAAPISYDYLIVAPGARHSYFGREEWEQFAPGLKSIEDARLIRQRFLLALERAEWETDPVERQKLMTFVLVGGGPTGVELAGVLPEMCRRAFRADFRRIDTAKVRVVLLEGGDRVLPTFPISLSQRATRDLQKLGVEVRTGARVTAIDKDGVSIGTERIESHSIFWAAGNLASPLTKSLNTALDKSGHVLVDADLSLPGDERVFVIGDAAAVKREDGRWVPNVAPAANQMGERAAKNIRALLRGKPTSPFRYVNKGELATIGRHKAIASFFDGKLRISGYIAWYFWLLLHIAYLVGFRNRLSVMLQWAYNYVWFERGVRLISDSEDLA
jgi:NADH dehydrogenase